MTGAQPPVHALQHPLRVACRVLAMLVLAGAPATQVLANMPGAAAGIERSLRFVDQADGSLEVIDAETGTLVERISGEAGFLRGTLRAVARERKRRSLGATLPFVLSVRPGTRMSLRDPATGVHIDLESFGPTNARVFARLLATPATRP